MHSQRVNQNVDSNKSSRFSSTHSRSDSHCCCCHVSPQFSSVAQSSPNLCDPKECNTPGFPVHHQLLELAQIHVHWVSDAITHLILCHPLILPPNFPSIRVFSNESILRIRWPKYWSFSFSINLPINIQDEFPLGLTGLISLQFKELSRVFSNTKVKTHQFFHTQPSLWSNSHIHIWLLEKPYLWL